jgi:hypothetical protein
MKTSQRIAYSFNKNIYSQDQAVSVVGGPIKPGARVTLHGRLGTFLWFYRDSKKLKVELDEPLGTLRLCSPNEVQLAE